jgi:hypothetical protein
VVGYTRTLYLFHAEPFLQINIKPLMSTLTTCLNYLFHAESFHALTVLEVGLEVRLLLPLPLQPQIFDLSFAAILQLTFFVLRLFIVLLRVGGLCDDLFIWAAPLVDFLF